MLGPWLPKLQPGLAKTLGLAVMTNEARSLSNYNRSVRSFAISARVALRNVRREGNDGIKELEKSKQISEDDWRRSQEQMQKLTDRYITQVDEVLSAKEHEILEV